MAAPAAPAAPAMFATLATPWAAVALLAAATRQAVAFEHSEPSECYREQACRSHWTLCPGLQYLPLPSWRPGGGCTPVATTFHAFLSPSCDAPFCHHRRCLQHPPPHRFFPRRFEEAESTSRPCPLVIRASRVCPNGLKSLPNCGEVVSTFCACATGRGSIERGGPSVQEGAPAEPGAV